MEPNLDSRTTDSLTVNKNETEIKAPKTPEVQNPIKKASEKASDGPKAFKVVAILLAVGAAITGFLYFMKNKNNNKSAKNVN